MNVSIHLHGNERATANCSQLRSGSACLTVSTTTGQMSIFGTLEQIEALHQSIALALYPEVTDVADIYGQG